ncbi:MAG TPA: CHAD domain-containing protein [Solirubrobacteraceae bacterium]|nr:CHAD domain-containing protein [Solirubrobacteraceae bacterium]
MTAGSELLLPDEMTLRGAGEALAARLDIEDGVQCDRDRIYYDTFDWLVRDAGLTLMHADGTLSVASQDSGVVVASLPIPAPTKPLFARELPPGPLRDTLLPITEVRALLALTHLHSHERPLAVLDDERKTVVRLALEEPSVVDSKGASSALRPRLRITGIRGYEKEFERVQETLVVELGFKPADQSLVDEAVRVAGGLPGGLPTKVGVPLVPDQRTDAAAAVVLRGMLEVIEANLDGTIADIDSEFLHDLRVSVRRSRSVQRELKRAFPPDQLEHYRAEFRWLQQATGDVRDLDVHVLEFDDMRALVPDAMRDDLAPLLRVLKARRAAARRTMVRALRSKRTQALLSGWGTFLDGLEATPEDERPDAARPIGEISAERIRKVYRRMLKMGGAIDPSSPAAAYHELRKKGKELRYLLELFGAPLFPEEVVRPMIKTLKSLQDVLGRHQDREVQIALLRSLGTEVAAVSGGEAALMAIGALVARLGEDERAARGEFAGRFAEFASTEQRRLVKETFA